MPLVGPDPRATRARPGPTPRRQAPRGSAGRVRLVPREGDGDLSAQERRDLHPVLREHAAERLLDWYLAEQDYVDLLKRRRPYRKKIGDLTPVDLPALVEADRQKAEKSAE